MDSISIHLGLLAKIVSRVLSIQYFALNLLTLGYKKTIYYIMLMLEKSEGYLAISDLKSISIDVFQCGF